MHERSYKLRSSRLEHGLGSTPSAGTKILSFAFIRVYLRLTKIVRRDLGDLEVQRLGAVQLHRNRSLLVLQDAFDK